ncbi:methyl-CpG-binding domain-containing protein 9-like isoform X2 [Apium graveolens]|uniref:methyl-CpG-binding domain-containing protein 9-like isoform X2 n=1 Tax=Apium graveolens TaxID=4045 RepID=UPI003D7A19E4
MEINSKSFLQIDLNEAPPNISSPREPPGSNTGSVVCGSCGNLEVEGEMLVCVRCGKGFHMKCMGTKQKASHWKCFSCLFAGKGGESSSERLRNGGGEGLLDMNAPPPQEDEDVQFLRARRTGGGMQAVFGTSVLRHSLNIPVEYSQLQQIGSGTGSHVHKTSQSATKDVMSMYEVPLHCRWNHDRMPRETDTRFKTGARFQSSHYEPPKLPPSSASYLYLQALKDFIFERSGVLGDGWHVEFDYCPVRCKTSAIYCAPDGRRFESMSSVADCLGLVRSGHAFEDENIGDGVPPLNKGHTRKEGARYMGAKYSRENKTVRKSILGGKSPLSAEILNADIRLDKNKRLPEIDQNKTDNPEYQHFCDGFPVRFEDLYIIHAGKVDLRNSYYDSGHIWPVGYKSCWHDRITGSVFVCEVLDGGADGPVFKVQRYPCTKHHIPSSSTVVWKQNGKCREEKDNLPYIDLDGDEYTSLQMILTESNPPCLDSNILSSSPAFEDSDSREVNCRTSGNRTNIGLGQEDSIGEFSVEGRSSVSAWKLVSVVFLDACGKAYKQKGVFKFGCEHGVYKNDVEASENVDLLYKFSYSGCPINTPHLIESDEDYKVFSEMLVNWVQQDRFGLDLEFVQELLEQLPDVHACSDYIFLNNRSPKSILQTVGSGFLVSERNNDVPVKKISRSSIQSCKTFRKKLIEDSEIKAPRPLGKTVSSRLPAYLIGDVLQVWEFLRRFSDILGLEEPFSFQELECELLNPWLDDLNPPHEKIANGTPDVEDANSFRNSRTTLNGETSACMGMVDEDPYKLTETHGKCNGVILTNAHSSLLNLLIGELLVKIMPYVDPDFDAGEIKSKRVRKKEMENLVSAKKAKLDLPTINDLTWPELARRYVLAVLSMEGNLDSTEIISKESGKVFHCLQGDGGILCGSLAGVAAMEADALLLAEATRKIFGSLKSTNDVFSVDQKHSDATDASNTTTDKDTEVPDWAQVLEPVRKLPTNVGARLRKCVYEALGKNPPEWAKTILEHSISKEVYKGNASGPTKRAVVSVLEDPRCEKLQQKPETKEKGTTVSIVVSDLLMKQCRLVLRRAAAADKDRVFCNLLGRTLLNPNDNDEEGLLGYPAMVSRPLDFRTVDLRLAAGAYNGSHEAFFEDVQEVWYNIRKAYGNHSKLTDLAETLSRKFVEMYEEEVLTLVHKIRENANTNSLSDEYKKELIDVLACATESLLPKAPWDEGVCKICGMDKHDVSVLLCDTCDSEYHTYCLNPPLVRIPEGNWYCPSCIARKGISHGVSFGTQISSLCRRKRYQRDLTNKYLDALANMAKTMETREYWEFSVEERIFLIKVLTDEVLNSAIFREHLDLCVSVSADLQQKLRSSTSEWNVLRYKEEILAAKGAEVHRSESNLLYRQKSPYVSESVMEKVFPPGIQITKAADTCVQFLHQQHAKDSIPDPPSCSIQAHPITRGNNEEHGFSMSTWLHNIKSSADKAQTNMTLREQESGSCNGSLLSTVQVIPSHILSDTIRADPAGIISSMNVNFSEVPDLEASSSLKKEISNLQNTIATLELDLFKASVRKECLGRDSVGRLYWVFGCINSPQAFVYGSSVEQSKIQEFTQRNPCMRNHVLVVESPSTSKGISFFNMHPAEQIMHSPESSSWTCYQSDSEIQELISWLGDDERERELRDSILHWQRMKPRDSIDVKKHFRGEHQAISLSSTPNEKFLDPSFLVTKAFTVLVKKLGPCLQMQTSDNLKQQKHKAETCFHGRIYRCECLELLWTSKQHCLRCHQTFATREELDKHTNGTCIMSLAVPESNKDLPKNKRVRSEPLLEDNSDLRNAKTLKAEKQKTVSCFNEQKHSGCPFDFEEIERKFVIQNSLTELIKDIGLIGSAGTPSFVPQVAHYLVDPILSLVPTSPSGPSSELENQQKISKKRINAVTGMNTGHSFSTSRNPENGALQEPSKGGKLSFRCTSGVDQLSATKNMLWGGKGAILHESSRRPIVGRLSAILRQLKINLLDMDAALPEESLRPSRATFEKRRVWRGFVKSAESIYEMIQATIVLEDMIKTAYLKKDWWYWSSPSVAAKICTISGLALRIYAFDAAIIYEDNVPSPEPSEVCKSSRESPSNLNLKTSTTPVSKDVKSDSPDLPRLRSRKAR